MPVCCRDKRDGKDGELRGDEACNIISLSSQCDSMLQGAMAKVFVLWYYLIVRICNRPGPEMIVPAMLHSLHVAFRPSSVLLCTQIRP